MARSIAPKTDRALAFVYPAINTPSVSQSNLFDAPWVKILTQRLLKAAARLQLCAQATIDSIISNRGQQPNLIARFQDQPKRLIEFN